MTTTLFSVEKHTRVANLGSDTVAIAIVISHIAIVISHIAIVISYIDSVITAL